MDFAFSDVQTALGELAQTLFTDFGSDGRVRDIALSGTAYDGELWVRLAETGLIGLVLPEAVGGGGLGFLDMQIVLEAQGRALAAVPLWRHCLCELALATFAGDTPLAKRLPDLVAGRLLATCSVEDIAAPALELKQQGTSWQLHGRVNTLPHGDAAAIALVPVRLNEATRLVLLTLDAKEIAATRGTLTHGESVADLVIDGLALPADCLLPPEASADWLLQRAIACVAALQLGVASEATRRTAEYTGTRHQFGRPIGSFQGVALRAADAYIDTAVARGAMLQLGWLLDQGLDAKAAAHVAKYWSSECGHRVAHTVAHLHGGLGADISYPIHRFLLWARALEMTAGGAKTHLFRLGDCIADQRTVGAAL